MYQFTFHGRKLLLNCPEFIWAAMIDGGFLATRVWLQGKTQCSEILTKEEIAQLIG